MQSVIRFLKNVTTLAFSSNQHERHHALHALAPKLWSAVWCVGHTRGSEQASYRHNRDIGNLTAENAVLRSQINQRGAGGKFVKKSPTE